jgi:CDP-4-dehydro-6-deoxyglucose reductase
MAQRLTLSRAARLAGVPRGVLQRQIHDGLLPSYDGTIDSADLVRLYPDLDFEHSGAFERVSGIKDAAFGRRVLERALPGQEILARRLFAQSQELADTRRHLQRYHDLVVAIEARAKALAQASGRDDVGELAAAVERGLAEVLATETADTLSIMDDVLKLVSARVVVRPSGREFFVDGRETLLEAALRAGVRLNYGCGNGTCGLCKARVVQGAVARVVHTDYPMSEAERQQGYTLLCAHSAATPEIELEALEARGPGDLPPQEIAVRVRGVTRLAPHTLLLHVQTPRTQRLRFLAGQGATLGASARGRDASASWPIASCPCDDRNLHFHVAHDPADTLATWLFDGVVGVGDTLNLRGPTGDFVLEESERPLLFLACDTGFAPAKSLIEHALAAEASESVTLAWLATRPDGHYLANQCRAWADSIDNFRYVGQAAADAAAGAAELVPAALEGLRPESVDAYVAGPAAFASGVEALLTARGVPASRVHVLCMD